MYSRERNKQHVRRVISRDESMTVDEQVDTDENTTTSIFGARGALKYHLLKRLSGHWLCHRLDP